MFYFSHFAWQFKVLQALLFFTFVAFHRNRSNYQGKGVVMFVGCVAVDLAFRNSIMMLSGKKQSENGWGNQTMSIYVQLCADRFLDSEERPLDIQLSLIIENNPIKYGAHQIFQSSFFGASMI